MLTLDEIQERAKKAGAPVTERTVWKYITMGLLPRGEKLPGQGNVRFYSDDTADQLVQLYWLNKRVGIPLAVLHKSKLYLREGEHWASVARPLKPSALDLIVWWAGAMANMRVLDKPSLDREDLAALFARVNVIFHKLGVETQ
jgi:hypothetical protein